MYWGRIKAAFDEPKLVGTDFANIHMDLGDKALANHWAMVQTVCNKWHGIVAEVAARTESDANVKGQVWTIESCENWRKVRLAFTKAKDTYNMNAPTPVAAEGRPDDIKKAKAERDAEPVAEWLQSSIEQCIADAKSNAAKMEEKSDARWSALMTNQHVKLNLLRTNVVAKKRNTDLTFLRG
ncbi:putative methionyl-tRNA synthetase [Hordeum vulgare]|nr:putative methionyl-tRNA synthetase [Hordeum vulgare]